MIQISPSVLSADFTKLAEQIHQVEEAGTEVLHIDIMDGHFVPNITFGPFILKQIRKITKLTLDVHLMISDPDKYASSFVDAGADYITVHQESTLHLHRSVQHIKHLGVKAGVSLNPGTHHNTLEYVLDDLDLVLVMSVNPGFGGQAFIPSSINKIKSIRKMINDKNLNTLIEVDGGVTTKNIEEIVRAGANWLVAGSAVFNTPNISDAIKSLQHEGRKGL
jgi:ribulose-phosphate 3-epimerase